VSEKLQLFTPWCLCYGAWDD